MTSIYRTPLDKQLALLVARNTLSQSQDRLNAGLNAVLHCICSSSFNHYLSSYFICMASIFVTRFYQLCTIFHIIIKVINFFHD